MHDLVKLRRGVFDAVDGLSYAAGTRVAQRGGDFFALVAELATKKRTGVFY